MKGICVIITRESVVPGGRSCYNDLDIKTKRGGSSRAHYPQRHRTWGFYVCPGSQTPEENRLTTTARAISAPQRHFSHITWRQVVAQPVPGVGAFAASRGGTGALLRSASAWAAAMTGIGVVDGDGDTEVDTAVGFIVPDGARVTTGESGFPSDRSPMLGKSRSSGVQCCERDVSD